MYKNVFGYNNVKRILHKNSAQQNDRQKHLVSRRFQIKTELNVSNHETQFHFNNKCHSIPIQPNMVLEIDLQIDYSMIFTFKYNFYDTYIE